MIEIQISDDQNQVTINGLVLEFYPVKRVKKTHCRHCWFFRGTPEYTCIGLVPCTSGMRDDGKNGVFSIREVPKQGGKS